MKINITLRNSSGEKIGSLPPNIDLEFIPRVGEILDLTGFSSHQSGEPDLFKVNEVRYIRGEQADNTKIHLNCLFVSRSTEEILDFPEDKNLVAVK